MWIRSLTSARDVYILLARAISVWLASTWVQNLDFTWMNLIFLKLKNKLFYLIENWKIWGRCLQNSKSAKCSTLPLTLLVHFYSSKRIFVDILIWDEFLALLSFLKAMESKCFARCIRKPGIQAEKSDEVKIIFILLCLTMYFFLGLLGKVYGQVYGILVCCGRNCRSHSI